MQVRYRQEQAKAVNREERKRDNYYAEFNVRQEELNKQQHRMALRRTIGSGITTGNTVEVRRDKNIDRSERKDTENLWKKFTYYIENDKEFRDMVYSKIGGISQREIETSDKDSIEEGDRRKKYREQERNRERETVLQIKKNYWRKKEEEKDRERTDYR